MTKPIFKKATMELCHTLVNISFFCPLSLQEIFHISSLKLLFLLSSGRLDCVSPENTNVFLLTFVRSIFCFLTNTHCLINHTKLS